jgi:hypothetical protein
MPIFQGKIEGLKKPLSPNIPRMFKALVQQIKFAWEGKLKETKPRVPWLVINISYRLCIKVESWHTLMWFMDYQQIVYLHLRLCKGGNFAHLATCVSNDDPSGVV